MDARDILVTNLTNLYDKLNHLDAKIEHFYEGLNKKLLGTAEREILHQLEMERDEAFQLARAFAGRLIRLDSKLWGNNGLSGHLIPAAAHSVKLTLADTLGRRKTGNQK